MYLLQNSVMVRDVSPCFLFTKRNPPQTSHFMKFCQTVVCYTLQQKHATVAQHAFVYIEEKRRNKVRGKFIHLPKCVLIVILNTDRCIFWANLDDSCRFLFSCVIISPVTSEKKHTCVNRKTVESWLQTSWWHPKVLKLTCTFLSLFFFTMPQTATTSKSHLIKWASLQKILA